MISVRLQGKPFNITVIQVYTTTSNAEEAEVEWFYEDLEEHLELRHEKDVLFIIGAAAAAQRMKLNGSMIFVCFQSNPFSITVIQVYATTSNAEEAEVEWFYEDVQHLLELKPKKDFLLIVGDWNAKVGSQETPGVTGKFGLGMRNEAGQRLIEFAKKMH